MFSLIRQECLDELYLEALKAPTGDFAEVGVYQGGSAHVLAKAARLRGSKLYLFDTFTGIPHADLIDHHQIGDFADTSLEQVQREIPEAIYCVGVFPQTLRPMNLALAHIDADQYRTIKDCCVFLGPMMVQGGIMIFDDCEALAGARAAVHEVFGDRVEYSQTGKARVRF